jgi:hypothetical protein
MMVENEFVTQTNSSVSGGVYITKYFMLSFHEQELMQNYEVTCDILCFIADSITI